jgi:RimJ/RimL family protein N-acetyltransferase
VWLSRDDILTIIRRLKESPPARGDFWPVSVQGVPAAWLVPISREEVDRAESIELLASWRAAAADGFPSQRPVTLAGTRRWLTDCLLDVPDRLLFWVKTTAGTRIGHVGLFRFDFDEGGFEIDNIVRGVEGELPGIMYHAVTTLLDWSFDTLGMEEAFLRVFNDNARAMRLYDRLGFRETMRMPLARVPEGDGIRWLEVTGTYRKPVSRYFVTMHLPRSVWADRAA